MIPYNIIVACEALHAAKITKQIVWYVHKHTVEFHHALPRGTIA